MRLIQEYLHRPRHSEIHRIFVKADPAEAWEAVRHFDMGSIPWVRVLFDIRTLPTRISGTPGEEDRRLGVDQVAAHGTGFQILDETPGREVVVGSVGKFWLPNIEFAEVNRERFASFNAPGYGKLAWSLSVMPFEKGSTVSVELRTTATDEFSWKKFNRYYGVIGIGSKLIRSSVMTHLEAALGKYERQSDQDRPIPGDDHLQHCKHQLTLSTDIEAPPSLVWRYLMQLGCDRAGWYSIDALDHGGKPSIDHQVEGWDSRQVGDKLQALPDKEGSFDVLDVQPGKYLVLGGGDTVMKKPYRATWTFVLEPIGNDATHLITRARMELESPVLEWVWGHAVSYPSHFVMQSAQLRNLKRICERDAQLRTLEFA